MLNDGYNNLGYDGENRVTSASNGSAAATYTYDANRLRVQKAVQSGTTTVYIFSGSSMIAEYDNGAAPSSPSREYIYSGSQMIAKIDASGTKYYLKDHLSTRMVTDNSGNVVEQHGHYPYGEVWYDGADKTKFTTYERDAETGNDYAKARYHISRLGRFNSVDANSGSSTDPQSLNRYVYGRNDPMNKIDPSGNDCEVDFNDGTCGDGGGDLPVGNPDYCGAQYTSCDGSNVPGQPGSYPNDPTCSANPSCGELGSPPAQ